jgi:RES domain-containing protein
MLVYRIVKSKARVNDLSGTGAFMAGGRWNSKGTYMLYTSENSSLAYLETLVHFNASQFPVHLYITTLSLRKNAMIYELPDNQYPAKWMEIGNPSCKILGDKWMASQEHLAIRVRSAINYSEYNYLINPLHPTFNSQVKMIANTIINIDKRLVPVI